MTLFALIAASFTFTATATGVAKGTPIEFAFAGNGSDRDYETMFLIDGSIDDFCCRLESAGLPRGKPEDLSTCTLWPVGCTVTLKPSLDEFITSKLSDGSPLSPLVYTGGTRLPSGSCVASTNMPLSVLSFFSLPQSPLTFATPYVQSEVYNCHLAKNEMKKGTRVAFTLSWDPATLPKPLSYVVQPGSSSDVIKSIQAASKTAELDVLVDFAPELTVQEAKTLSEALSVIDSRQVKINGCKDGHLYYRAFLPAIKWLDRKERLVQPFELSVGPTNALVYVAADWSVEGIDPKLTPTPITFKQAKNYPDTDTCFLYASASTRLSELYAAMALMKETKVRTWYVYVR